MSQANSKTIKDARIGIIDIGSNSIRLVVYDQNKRTPIPIYNEKVLCALGKGLASSGVLNLEGVVMGKQALRRFVAMGRNMGIAELHVIATAAIRDAKDGKDFTGWLETTYNVKADIISGDEEAKLGAFAVCSSIYKPKGITADLGGGSLELVRVDNGEIHGHNSILLGSLRMLDESKGDRNKLRKLIDKRFAEINWKKLRVSMLLAEASVPLPKCIWWQMITRCRFYMNTRWEQQSSLNSCRILPACPLRNWKNIQAEQPSARHRFPVLPWF